MVVLFTAPVGGNRRLPGSFCQPAWPTVVANKVEDDNQHLWAVLWLPHVYSHKYAGTHICTKIFFKKSKTGLLLGENYFKYKIKVEKDVNIYIQYKG